MKEILTPLTDAWLATQPEYTKKWEVTHLLRQLERDRHELKAALQDVIDVMGSYDQTEVCNDARALLERLR